MAQQLLPHSHVHIVRSGPDAATCPGAPGLPQLPIVSVRHALPILPATATAGAGAGPASPAVADPLACLGFGSDQLDYAHVQRHFGLTSAAQNASVALGQRRIVPPAVSSFPVALADLPCGGLAISGAGAGGAGAHLHALDARSATGAPPWAAPLAQRKGVQSAASSAATNAALLGRSVLSSALATVDRHLAAPESSAEAAIQVQLHAQIQRQQQQQQQQQDDSAAGCDSLEPVGDCVEATPAWAGTSGALSVAGAMALPLARRATVSALAFDEDALLAALDDGSLLLFRVGGVEALASLVQGPNARSRPCAVMRGPAVGAPTCAALARDGDAAAVGFVGEAWLFELGRARPLQQIALAVPEAAARCAAAAAAPLSAPFCSGLCFTADGGLVVATTVFAMARASGVGARAAAADCEEPAPAPDVLHAGPAFSELRLFGSAASASALEPAPQAALQLPGRVTCLQRLRGGGTGDWRGAGALVAVGRSDGSLALLCARSLRELVVWETPQRAPCFCVDLSPCTGYLVAGCANGLVAAFALPAFIVTVPCERPDVALADSRPATQAVAPSLASAAPPAPPPATSAPPAMAVSAASASVKNAVKVFGSLFSRPSR